MGSIVQYILQEALQLPHSNTTNNAQSAVVTDGFTFVRGAIIVSETKLVAVRGRALGIFGGTYFPGLLDLGNQNEISGEIVPTMTMMKMAFLSNSSSSSNIPLLDTRLLEQHPEQFVDQLRTACHGTGFFLLRHHLDPFTVQQMLAETRTFFAQSVPNKMQISYENQSTFRGYMRMGVENTAGLTDYREQVELATEYDTSEDGLCGEKVLRWPPYERLKGCNPWPTTFQPSLQTTTERYVHQVQGLAAKLVSALCLALKLPPDAANSLFGDKPHWALKLVSYPPIHHTTTATCGANENRSNNAAAPTESLFGVGSHTDTNFLTMILQDNGVEAGALQVYTTGGEWINVQLPRNTHDGSENYFICNLGEQAEILSGGYFLATPHRVRLTAAPRISVPFFYNPALSATVTPLVHPEQLSLLPWERSDVPPTWRMSSNSDNTLLSSVGENTFKSLARSHPTVFARHHPDLKVLPTGQVVRNETTEYTTTDTR
jgi:isopenicillin N synthase-like dioxygenase